MKTMIAAVFAVMVASSGIAAVAAEIVFDVRTVSGKMQLWAEARITGIPKGEAFEYKIQWTAPDVFYERKDGSKIRLFQHSTMTPSKPAGTTLPGGCFCADTGEKQCWRTRAYRTIETTLGNGEQVIGVGVWRVNIVRTDTDEVIGTGSHEVK